MTKLLRKIIPLWWGKSCGAAKYEMLICLSGVKIYRVLLMHGVTGYTGSLMVRINVLTVLIRAKCVHAYVML